MNTNRLTGNKKTPSLEEIDASLIDDASMPFASRYAAAIPDDSDLESLYGGEEESGDYGLDIQDDSYEFNRYDRY